MTVPPIDRAAAARGALRTLVAPSGFHGASMSAVASEAGVATGTACTHCVPKDELALAAYRETKARLAAPWAASTRARGRSSRRPRPARASGNQQRAAPAHTKRNCP